MNFSNDLKTGVPVVDKQHRGFFEAIRKLRNILAKKHSEDDLEASLHYLEVYSHTHFEAEEYYMSLSKWPDASAHKNEHKAFNDNLVELRKDLEVGEEDTGKLLRVIDFMAEWLVGHIANTDKKFVEHLKENKIEFVGDLPVQNLRD